MSRKFENYLKFFFSSLRVCGGGGVIVIEEIYVRFIAMCFN